MNADLGDCVSRVRRDSDMVPALALVLGSGLDSLVETMPKLQTVPYADLPGFPEPGVAGHRGELVLGRLRGVPVAILRGRSHFYESGRMDGMYRPLELIRALGCERLLLTNAAGSLDPDLGPGRLMLIRDHIKLAAQGPLLGTSDSARFVNLVDAYDASLRDCLRRAAEQAGIVLSEGVYMWFAGPNFETPAEIRAARILGADAVGMSTVPEVILARYLGLRVAAISVITNLGAGMSDTALSHQQTLQVGRRAVADLQRVLCAFAQEVDRAG